MATKVENKMIGLLQTILERVESLEIKIKNRNIASEGELMVWTPKDVERKFGLGLRQQYNLRQKGVLPFIQKTPNGPVTYFPADVLDYFLNSAGA